MWAKSFGARMQVVSPDAEFWIVGKLLKSLTPSRSPTVELKPRTIVGAPADPAGRLRYPPATFAVAFVGMYVLFCTLRTSPPTQCVAWPVSPARPGVPHGLPLGPAPSESSPNGLT